jgi:hypothetical protein
VLTIHVYPVGPLADGGADAGDAATEDDASLTCWGGQNWNLQLNGGD